ncbi:hypothetical protein HYV80_01290 [Candidatus Woesearchaeota archaeon]|nr:hypothetical protein [Candidatus Woesearchaeota archaeon]
MADIAAVISNNLLISCIRAVAALLFLTAFFYMAKIHQRAKDTTDVWLLVSFAAFTAFLISLSNSLEWYFNRNATLDAIGVYLGTIFSLVWVYIAFRFMSMRKG